MHLTTDKALYHPGERVQVHITNLPEGCVSVETRVWHLGDIIHQERFAGAEYLWSSPAEDFRGYLLCLSALDDEGVALANAQIGIDVSSSWTRFPRYGYLWDFTSEAHAEACIEHLSRFHINALQYYDWQYRHHQPLHDDLRVWQDWSGRWISGDALRQYLRAARDRGMVSLAYNMIYAANGSYLTDGSGVDPAWRLVKPDGSDFAIRMGEGGGG